MKPKEILEKILEETYLLSSAIDVKDIEMVIVTLERRNEWVETLNSEGFDKSDLQVKELLQKFYEENKLCIEKMGDFRISMEVELDQVKGQKKKMKQTQKVHDQYSNPYVNNAVGNAFDLKK